MKIPVIPLLFVLIAANVLAASVSLTPTSIYETTTVWEIIDVNNYKGSTLITQVTVDSPDLTITNAENYTGWTTTFSAGTAKWKDGVLATNIKSAWFEFQVSAPNVTTNVTKTLTVNTGTIAIFNITVLNDATPPSITNLKPVNYAKANNPAQQVGATVTDAETSVTSVSYSWNNCAGGDTAIFLAKSGDDYNGLADFSAFDEGSKACYTVTAKNAPGETATLTGELLFDGTAPSVTIISPTAFATETTEFSFNATDNIATILSCVLKLDDTELGIINATNGTTTQVTKDLSSFDQGSHTWSVTCTDGVGLSATHVQAIILDTAPPAITLDAPATLPRTQTTTFTATVTDTIGLANVNASYDGQTVALTQNGDKYTGSMSSDVLGTKTLVVQAQDDAGHVTTSTAAISIVPNHQLTLSLSPTTVSPGGLVTASGTLTPEGNATSTNVTIKTPSGDYTVDLADDDYSVSFNAPGAGTYVITTEYLESGHVYKAQATLYVQSGQQQDYSSGPGADAWRTSGYVKPDEETQSTSGGDNQQTETTETPTSPEPEQEYTPLPPEEPREAITPKTTGVFTLGGTIKWLALLLAAGLLAALGAYAYRKRKKEDDGIDWKGYFKG